VEMGVPIAEGRRELFWDCAIVSSSASCSANESSGIVSFVEDAG